MKQKQLIRQCFRDAVFKRDGYKCVFCDVHTNLDAHHITDRSLMPNGGYVKENGITLCGSHHYIAEKFHMSGGQSWDVGFHPNDLYKQVDSDYQRAYNASLKLK